ncbi:hypothetical protein CF326_g1363 [Tilletia indica]|nr:hypothetical protein CF326_g1363 [Tilletia indica]
MAGYSSMYQGNGYIPDASSPRSSHLPQHPHQHQHQHDAPFNLHHRSPSTLLWGEHNVADIPHRLIMAHPQVQSIVEQLNRATDRVTSLEATNTELASTISNLTANKPQNPSSAPKVKGTVIEAGDSSQGVDMTMTPSIPLEQFVNPELMLWTQAEAQKLHKNRKFGKEEITRDVDGNPIDDETVDEIEAAVQIAVASLNDIELPDWLKHKIRNYELYHTYYLRALIIICQGLEKRFPVLSWCTMHYKALFWIQKHLKSKCETVARAKRKAAEMKRKRGNGSSDTDDGETIPTQTASRAPRPSARKKQNASASNQRPVKIQE